MICTRKRWTTVKEWKGENMDRVKRKERILKYRGAIVDVYDDIMEIPDGSTAHWDYIEHRNGAAAVLPVLEDGRVVLVRQYRSALDQETLEIPADAKEEKEEPSMECAAREMEEETGYRPGSLEELITVCTTGAFCNESIDVYLARNLTKTSQHLDRDEFLNVEFWDLDEACSKIYSMEIKDAKTVSALLAYKNKYCK